MEYFTAERSLQAALTRAAAMAKGSPAMSDDDTPAARAVSWLAGELAVLVARRYRIEVDAAKQLILVAWANEPALWEQAAKDEDPGRLARTRAYRQAADRAKAKIYYHLRRYRDDGDLHGAAAQLRDLVAAGAGPSDAWAREVANTVARGHVSTRERLDDLEPLLAAIFAWVPEPTSILDLGCGVMPLLWPFDRPFDGTGRTTTRYLALDRDAVAVELCSVWAELVGGGRLEARRWALEEGFSSITGPEPDGGFALGLALKLVPVVARQERERLPILASAPVRRLLVTGAKQAMVKRRAIDRREERVLLAFAEDNGLSVVGELDTPSELGFLLERP